MTESNIKNTICKEYCYRDKLSNNYGYNVGKLDSVELVVFDMDGVLTNILSSWKYIHDYFHTSNDRSVQDYLKGKIDDMEFIRRDAALWQENGKPIKSKRLVEILSDVPLTTGARNCISFLQSNNVVTAIVSAGLDILANRIADLIGVDHVFANGIKSDEDGFLTCEGVVDVRLMHKEDSILRLSESLDITLNNIVSVGNSCFDISMFDVSGLGVAFNPEDDCVRRAADFVFEGSDLCMILPVFEKFF